VGSVCCICICADILFVLHWTILYTCILYIVYCNVVNKYSKNIEGLTANPTWG